MNKFKNWLMRMMQGRYGSDILGRDLTFLSLAFAILGLILKNGLMTTFGFIILLFVNFRMFSRNINKRYRENSSYFRLRSTVTKKFKNFFKRIKDFPKYKYIRCPNCNKQLRLPRGKKEIVVSCPKCHHKFDAKT